MAGMADYLSGEWDEFTSAFLRRLMEAKQDRPRFDRGMLSEAIASAPGIGDAMSAGDALLAATQGRWGDAALGAVGALPFMPAMVGSTKGSLADALRAASEGLTQMEGAAPHGWKGVPARPQGDGTLNYPLPDHTLNERPSKPPNTLMEWLNAEATRLDKKRR